MSLYCFDNLFYLFTHFTFHCYFTYLLLQQSFPPRRITSHAARRRRRLLGRYPAFKMDPSPSDDSHGVSAAPVGASGSVSLPDPPPVGPPPPWRSPAMRTLPSRRPMLSSDRTARARPALSSGRMARYRPALIPGWRGPVPHCHQVGRRGPVPSYPLTGYRGPVLRCHPMGWRGPVPGYPPVE